MGVEGQMIYSVTEHWPDDGSINFLFDTSKVDPNQPFEAAYLELLQAAAAAPDNRIDTDLLGDLDGRCDDYQEGTRCWKRLLAKMPCVVSRKVEVWIGS